MRSIVQQQATVPPAAGELQPREPPVAPSGIVRGSAPAHINLAPTEGRRLRSASDLSTAMRTPGAGTLGTAALTPALLHDIPAVPPTPVSGSTTPNKPGSSLSINAPSQKVTFVKDNALSPIPASPPATSTPGITTATRTPGASTSAEKGQDYFSGKGRARSASVATDVPEDAPGGGKFMGRLRNFGKTSRKHGTDVSAPAIAEDKDSAPAEAADPASASLRMVSKRTCIGRVH